MVNPDHDLCPELELSQDFSANLKIEGDLQEDHKNAEENEALVEVKEEEEEKEVEEEEEEEEEFSFMCGGEDVTFIAAEDCFINGQIKAVYPFFNQDSLFHGEDSDSLTENLPMRPPAMKVLVEMNEDNTGAATSSTPGDDEITGPCCEWSNRKAVEVSPPQGCKKCNSTGFSKIWRFKEFIRRSNSDGRDVFVFLHNGRSQATAEPKSAKDSTVPINAKVKKSGKSKSASLSAYEVYLRSKGKEEQRRRSYLPYRPELMGFFTNVNVGLTKNVHPF